MASNVSDDPAPSHEAIVFGPFHLFPARRLLLEAGKPIRLGSRAFDILTTLIDNAGKMVSKNELVARVWPGVFIDDGNIRVHIAALRRLLGDGQRGRRLIVTAPGRGYCFIAPLSREGRKSSEAQYEMPQTPPDNLPKLYTRMVGRDGTTESLVAQLPQCKFITIVGPGGVGKTTVALAVAYAMRSPYRDGVRLVDFTPIADPALVPSVLAAILGLSVSSNNFVPTLINALRDKEMLLVLDNCEHVVDVVATLAEQVLKAAPGVHILATSREALRAKGERVQQLPPLEAPPVSSGLTSLAALTFPAVQLFVERVSATLASFEVSDADAPVIAEICRRLDGNALALELAAARVDAFGVRGVAARLDDRFNFLTRGYRTALPHHQTLRATFDWSYELLADVTQAVLRRLAVLAGTFSLNTVTAITGGIINESDVADQVAVLVSTSMLSADIAGETVYYRLLDSTRAYARAKLVECGELDQFARQHAEYFLEVFRRAEPESATWPAVKWLGVYGRQLDNVRVALDWALSPHGDAPLGVDLTIAATPLWLLMSLDQECRSRIEAAIESLGPGVGREGRRGMMLFAALGTTFLYTQRFGVEARRAWSNTLKLAQTLKDTDYQLRALKGLWTDAFNTGDLGSASTFGKQFSTVARMSADGADVLLSDRMMGMTLFYSGELEGARVHTKRALNGYAKTTSGLDVLRFQFDQRMICCTNLSKILWLQGLPIQALRMAESSIEYAKAVGHGLSLTYALAYSACRLALLTGNLGQAECYLEMLFQRASLDPGGNGTCWAIAGRVSFLAGRVTRSLPFMCSGVHLRRFPRTPSACTTQGSSANSRLP